MQLFDAIRERRSHRSFSQDPVEPEKIDQILEAAQWAPSPANNQPWEFIVITGEAARMRLIELSENAHRDGRIELRGFSYIRPLPQGNEEDDAERSPVGAYSLSFLKNVPVMIAVVGDPDPTIRPKAVDMARDGYKYACAAAIQNMLLAAQDLGLGSLWFTLFDRKTLADFLHIAPHKHPVAIVCIGYADSLPPVPRRLPLHTRVRRMA